MDEQPTYDDSCPDCGSPLDQVCPETCPANQ